MSQLYFTSSLITNQKFLTLENLFKEISPDDVLLVFDSNLVIYYRDFYLNPQKFINEENTKNIYWSIRYLVEQIDRYDLRVNASIGINESSRSVEDFSINENKFYQTHKALMAMFTMNLFSLDEHIMKGKIEEPIFNEAKYPLSKLKSLSQLSIFQHLIIISYAACLRIFILQSEIQENIINPKNAYLKFLNFMTQKIDCVGSTIFFFALHLFGGVTNFKSILFSKNNVPIERRLHQIYNGSIDLVLPYLTNKVQEIFPDLCPYKLIPILVTFDKRLATLHSLINTKIIYEGIIENGINYNPELTEIIFHEKMIWSESDLKEFSEYMTKDFDHRWISGTSGRKTATHLIPIVEELELKVLEIMMKQRPK